MMSRLSLEILCSLVKNPLFSVRYTHECLIRPVLPPVSVTAIELVRDSPPANRRFRIHGTWLRKAGPGTGRLCEYPPCARNAVSDIAGMGNCRRRNYRWLGGFSGRVYSRGEFADGSGTFGRHFHGAPTEWIQLHQAAICECGRSSLRSAWIRNR